MNVYISLPISDRDIDAVQQRLETIKAAIAANGDNPISPLELCPFSDHLSYSECMGRDIKALLESDAAFFDNDYQESKGCMLERAAAYIYGIEEYQLIV